MFLVQAMKKKQLKSTFIVEVKEWLLALLRITTVLKLLLIYFQRKIPIVSTKLDLREFLSSLSLF